MCKSIHAAASKNCLYFIFQNFKFDNTFHSILTPFPSFCWFFSFFRFHLRMCLQQFSYGFCESIDQSGQTAVLRRILLRQSKLVHATCRGHELEASGVRLFFRSLTRLSMKRQVKFVLFPAIGGLCYFYLPIRLLIFWDRLSQQFMEVVKLENMGHYRDDMIMPSDIFLLQVSLVLPFHIERSDQLLSLTRYWCFFSLLLPGWTCSSFAMEWTKTLLAHVLN